jgi:Glycosyltransferases, probably involved in cell wall biogenesis
MSGRLFWFCVATIAYTYAGYPALLTILARLRPERPFPPLAELPMVTLLIAAYNEQNVIAAKLANSLALDYPRERLQILVAADGSNDATPEIVAGFADQGVELSYRPERAGKMAAILRALPQARGDIVVLSDANNFYSANALRALVAPFADPMSAPSAAPKSSPEEMALWETRKGCTGSTSRTSSVRRRGSAVAPARSARSWRCVVPCLIARCRQKPG